MPRTSGDVAAQSREAGPAAEPAPSMRPIVMPTSETPARPRGIAMRPVPHRARAPDPPAPTATSAENGTSRRRGCARSPVVEGRVLSQPSNPSLRFWPTVAKSMVFWISTNLDRLGGFGCIRLQVRRILAPKGANRGVVRRLLEQALNRLLAPRPDSAGGAPTGLRQRNSLRSRARSRGWQRAREFRTGWRRSVFSPRLRADASAAKNRADV